MSAGPRGTVPISNTQEEASPGSGEYGVGREPWTSCVLLLRPMGPGSLPLLLADLTFTPSPSPLAGPPQVGSWVQRQPDLQAFHRPSPRVASTVCRGNTPAPLTYTQGSVGWQRELWWDFRAGTWKQVSCRPAQP